MPIGLNDDSFWSCSCFQSGGLNSEDEVKDILELVNLGGDVLDLACGPGRHSDGFRRMSSCDSAPWVRFPSDGCVLTCATSFVRFDLVINITLLSVNFETRRR